MLSYSQISLWNKYTTFPSSCLARLISLFEMLTCLYLFELTQRQQALQHRRQNTVQCIESRKVHCSWSMRAIMVKPTDSYPHFRESIIFTVSGPSCADSGSMAGDSANNSRRWHCHQVVSHSQDLYSCKIIFYTEATPAQTMNTVFRCM